MKTNIEKPYSELAHGLAYARHNLGRAVAMHGKVGTDARLPENTFPSCGALDALHNPHHPRWATVAK